MPIKRVPVESLRRTQNYIDPAKVEHYTGADWDKLPFGLEHKGVVYLVDGHHRTWAHLSAGHKTIPMHVLSSTVEKFVESEHPRDEAGKFSSGGGGGAANPKPRNARGKAPKEETYGTPSRPSTSVSDKGDHISGTIKPSPDDTPEQKTIQSKIGKSDTILEGGIGDVKIVTMTDGSKYVWKPSTGEVGTGTSVPAGEQYAREVAAYDIATIVGLENSLPVVSIHSYKGDLGAMMVKIPNAKNDGKRGDSNFEDTAARATFFDYVIGNSDRHGANWMSDTRGKLWLIDHGRAFPNKSLNTPLLSGLEFGIKDKKEVIPESIKKPWVGKWSEIEHAARRRGLGDGAVA
ncbi:MAG: hypothetical protein ACREXT_08100, partial [Gammaproteobacteria bacterium]